MYEDLIKRLRSQCRGYGKECEDCNADGNCRSQMENEAADAIEELSKMYLASEVDNTNLTGWLAEEHAKHLWIPVTEWLPKADEHDAHGYAVPYLVMNGWMMVTARRTKDYWVLFGKGTVLEYVTHWMPLPEPPKEES